MKNSHAATRALLTVLLVILIQSCASAGSQRLDDELALEPDITNRKALQVETTSLINQSTTMSADQKSKLLNIAATTRSQLDALNNKSWKLRAILVRNMIANKSYDPGEINLIKSRLHGIENKRLEVIFSALDQANSFVDHQNSDNEMIMRQMFDEGIHH